MNDKTNTIWHRLGLGTSTLAACLLGVAFLLTPGCDSNDPGDEMEDAVEEVEDAAEGVGDEMEEAADDMGN